MNERTIKEAVIDVLKINAKPLSAKEIYDCIVELKLFVFNAKNPEGVLKATVRKHCDGLESNGSSKQDKIFKTLPDGKYALK